MKKIKRLLFGLVLSLPLFVFADVEDCGTVTVNDNTIYRVCDGEVTKKEFSDDVRDTYGLTISDDGIIHINDGDIYYLVITNFNGLKISVDSNSVVNTLATLNSEITITGEGVLNLGYLDMPVVFNNSKITFDNANVVFASDKPATPPASVIRSSFNLSGTDDYVYSLFNLEGSEVNFKNSKLEILEGYSDGIEMDLGSKLSFDNSDVDIAASSAGIFALDVGVDEITENSFSKLVVKNSNLNINGASIYGIYVHDIENDNSNIIVNGFESDEEESAAIYSAGRLASKNGKFHLGGYNFGLLVINPAALQLDGGLYDIKANLGTIALKDYGNNGPFKLNDTLVTLMGSNEIVSIDVDDDVPYKIYSFGKMNGDTIEFDTEVLLKGYEDIKVLEGQGQSFYEGTQSNLVFKIDRESLEFFEKLLLNGEVIDANDYTIEGNVVTISQRVISKLAIGEYVFTVKYVEGEAKVNVSIIEKEVENPFTGSLLGYIVIAGMILLICTAFIVMKHSWVSE